MESTFASVRQRSRVTKGRLSGGQPGQGVQAHRSRPDRFGGGGQRTSPRGARPRRSDLPPRKPVERPTDNST